VAAPGPAASDERQAMHVNRAIKVVMGMTTTTKLDLFIASGYRIERAAARPGGSALGGAAQGAGSRISM